MDQATPGSCWGLPVSDVDCILIQTHVLIAMASNLAMTSNLVAMTSNSILIHMIFEGNTQCATNLGLAGRSTKAGQQLKVWGVEEACGHVDNHAAPQTSHVGRY